MADLYMLHYLEPYGNNGHGDAHHYTGIAQDAMQRIDEHRRGVGSAISAHAHGLGIPFVVVLLEEGFENMTEARKAERAVKRNGHRKARCPFCVGSRSYTRNNINNKKGAFSKDNPASRLFATYRVKANQLARSIYGTTLSRLPKATQYDLLDKATELVNEKLRRLMV